MRGAERKTKKFEEGGRDRDRDRNRDRDRDNEGDRDRDREKQRDRAAPASSCIVGVVGGGGDSRRSMLMRLSDYCFSWAS